MEYVLRVEGFNSLTDTDEVRSYYNYVNFCYCCLSLYSHECAHTHILAIHANPRMGQ